MGDRGQPRRGGPARPAARLAWPAGCPSASCSPPGWPSASGGRTSPGRLAICGRDGPGRSSARAQRRRRRRGRAVRTSRSRPERSRRSARSARARSAVSGFIGCLRSWSVLPGRWGARAPGASGRGRGGGRGRARRRRARGRGGHRASARRDAHGGAGSRPGRRRARGPQRVAVAQEAVRVEAVLDLLQATGDGRGVGAGDVLRREVRPEEVHHLLVGSPR